MIYLDHGATAFPKAPGVAAAMFEALGRCANPGRGGYPAAMAAAEEVYACRELAGKMFDCQPEQVAFTSSCTQGLNTAIRTLVKPGDRVVITGFEHNAVTRPLYGMGAKIMVAGRKLFDWDDTLDGWEAALKTGPAAAVFTHVSNVFGYILPIDQMADLCRRYRVPFIVDGAQSAGMMPLRLGELGADFIAIPGHKGLLGPQGTGLLLCGSLPEPFVMGGTGSHSKEQAMPDFLPDRVEAGTLNVPGIAGLSMGMRYVNQIGSERILRRQCRQREKCQKALQELGFRVFAGEHQSGTLSFVPGIDPQQMAYRLAKRGIAVRAGFHCAPLAHESAGTLETGTVRLSFGHDACELQSRALLRALKKLR